MGNTNSQTAQLHKTGSLVDTRHKYRDPSGRRNNISRYVSPEHKVLPAPVVGQRLKNTDNGNILQNGGTISGRKLGKFNSVDEQDPEVLAILHKRSTLIDQQRDKDEESLGSSKRFHSDPDIANLIEVQTGSRCPSKSKINKAKRKHKAPQPPSVVQKTSTLPSELEKVPLYEKNGGKRKGRNQRQTNSRPSTENLVQKNASRTKSPAPQPPADNVGHRRESEAKTIPNPPPPPPPPLPFNNLNKSTHPVGADRWNRNQINLKEPEVDGMYNRSCADGGKHGFRNQQSNDPRSLPSCLQDDIKAAVQRRLSNENVGGRSSKITPLKQYYFSGESSGNVRERTTTSSPPVESVENVPKPRQQYYFGANVMETNAGQKVKNKSGERRPEREIAKAVVKRTFSTSENNVETKRIEYVQSSGRKSADELAVGRSRAVVPERRINGKSRLQRSNSYSSSSSEYDREISMNLRPVVPSKRCYQPLRFSPTEAWRSISVDDARKRYAKNQSSDESEVFEDRIDFGERRSVGVRSALAKSGDSGISQDTGSVAAAAPLRERFTEYSPHVELEFSNRNRIQSPERSYKSSSSGHNKSRSANVKQHWTPEQDLSDDGDDGGQVSGYRNAQNNSMVVHVQPKLVTRSGAFSSLPFYNYPLYQRELINNEDDTPLSPSEKVKEKSRRAGRRKKSSKSSSSDTQGRTNSLQSIKKSMKAAFFANKKQFFGNADELDNVNWCLSRSIPGSLNELDFESRMTDTGHEEPDELHRPLSSRSGLVSSPLMYNQGLLLFQDNYRSLPQLDRIDKKGSDRGHVVYLPEYSTVQVPLKHSKRKARSKDDVNSATRTPSKRGEGSVLPKRSRDEEKRKQWMEAVMKDEMQETNSKQPEWMSRVEEEFRQKRDREKASIRQQLRILNLERKNNRYLSADDTALESSDSPNAPSTPEYRYRSRSEDGLSRSPSIRETRFVKSRSHDEIRDDPISGPYSLPIIPPPPQNSLPPLDYFLENKKQAQSSMSTSSPTTSSSSYVKPDSSGISKWFQRKAKNMAQKSSSKQDKSDHSQAFRNANENERAKREKTQKKPSIYRQLNELVEREEKFLNEKNRPSNDVPSRIFAQKVNSAGESYSESDDVEVYNSRKNIRPTNYELNKDSSDDGNIESGFYSSSDRRVKSYREIKDDSIVKSGAHHQSVSSKNDQTPVYDPQSQMKVPAAYAQPFSPSKGYRPVAFNPAVKSTDKFGLSSVAKGWKSYAVGAS